LCHGEQRENQQGGNCQQKTVGMEQARWCGFHRIEFLGDSGKTRGEEASRSFDLAPGGLIVRQLDIIGGEGCQPNYYG
jgi:hypothetical protein